MANGVFNIAKGRAYEFYRNVEGNSPTNSAFIVVLLKDTVAVVDDTLNNHDTVTDVLAVYSEANFTNYARKVLTDAELAAIPAPDDTNNRVDLDIPDLVYTAAGGASNNNVVKLLVCYDSDTTAGTDANIVPVTYHDFVVTTDGTDITAVVAAAGFFRASHV